MNARLASVAALAMSILASNAGARCVAAAEQPPAKSAAPPVNASATHGEDQPFDERAKAILDKAAINLMAIGSIEFRAERDMDFSFPNADPKVVKDLLSHGELKSR